MMDRIGLDVIEQVLSNARWADTDQVSLERLIEILQGPLKQGNLGVKTGRGFYDYRKVAEGQSLNDPSSKSDVNSDSSQ